MTMRCSSSNRATARPSTAITSSPGWKPPASAADPGMTSPTTAGVNGWPTMLKRPASTTMAKMKLAIGPAATMAARWPSRLCGKATARSASLMLSLPSAGPAPPPPGAGVHLAARLEAARPGGRPRHALADDGRRERLADDAEEAGQHHDGEDEIGDRPRRDDGGALAEPLVREGDGALRFAHALAALRRHAGGVGVAEHLHVAAERNQAELPAGAGLVVPAEELRPEADGEHLDPHTVPAGHQVVAQLVDKHQGREHGQEREPVAVESSREIHDLELCPSVTYQDMGGRLPERRSEEHTYELQSLMRISYDVLCVS